MADTNRKSEKNTTKAPPQEPSRADLLSPEELRRIAGGASVPAPSPQPNECRKKG
jgi:hypothetical protein